MEKQTLNLNAVKRNDLTYREYHTTKPSFRSLNLLIEHLSLEAFSMCLPARSGLREMSRSRFHSWYPASPKFPQTRCMPLLCFIRFDCMHAWISPPSRISTYRTSSSAPVAALRSCHLAARNKRTLWTGPCSQFSQSQHPVSSPSR